MQYVKFLLLGLLAGCSADDQTPHTTNQQSVATTDNPMHLKTFAGTISITDLPPHRGLSLSLAFFAVLGPDSAAPFDGDPPAEAVADVVEVFESVDLHNEIADASREIPFSIKHTSGHYYILIRAILYRQQQGRYFAQTEQFFFGRRPLPLTEDLPSVTLPIAWPAIPL